MKINYKFILNFKYKKNWKINNTSQRWIESYIPAVGRTTTRGSTLAAWAKCRRLLKKIVRNGLKITFCDVCMVGCRVFSIAYWEAALPRPVVRPAVLYAFQNHRFNIAWICRLNLWWRGLNGLWNWGYDPWPCEPDVSMPPPPPRPHPLLNELGKHCIAIAIANPHA